MSRASPLPVPPCDTCTAKFPAFVVDACLAALVLPLDAALIAAVAVETACLQQLIGGALQPLTLGNAEAHALFVRPALALGLNTHDGQVTYGPVAEAHGMASVPLGQVLGEREE